MFTFVNMKERFEFILKHYRISQFELSEKLGVSKSTVSHLLSGRNKPGLEIIIAVMECFPDLNAEWFILGKGNKLKEINGQQKPQIDVKKIIKDEIQKLEYSIDMTHRELQHQLSQIKLKLNEL